jgi:hypothetical protein
MIHAILAQSLKRPYDSLVASYKTEQSLIGLMILLILAARAPALANCDMELL